MRFQKYSIALIGMVVITAMLWLDHLDGDNFRYCFWSIIGLFSAGNVAEHYLKNGGLFNGTNKKDMDMG